MNSKTVDLKDWLERKARSSERLRSYRDAVSYYTSLLNRLTRTSYNQLVDVTELAAIHYRLGLAHRALRDPMKSLYHLKNSVRLNSTEPRYYEAFGKAFLSGGHWRVAKAQFEKAVSLDPKNVTYLRQYSWVLLMMGHKEEALSHIKRALKLKPRCEETKWMQVRIYMEAEMFLQAVTILNVMKSKKNVEKVRTCLAECYEKMETTFEGLVLKLLRKGMPCDGKPFTIRDLRLAEKLWVDRIVSKPLPKKMASDPRACAAAVAWLSLYRQGSESDQLEALYGRFSTSALEVWPYLKRLQEA